MIVCKQCHKENSLDSRFCRSCGIGLSDDDIKAERLKLDDLVAEGYRQFSSGQTEDARLIAEAAIKDDPSHSSAISLLGMALERQGNIAEALECYEKVLELNPDSALDRIKVTQLRNSLASQLKTAPPPNKKVAFAAAAAATVLIICIGSAAAIIAGQKSPPVNQEPNIVAKNDPAGFSTNTDSVRNNPAPNQPNIDNQDQPGTGATPNVNTNSGPAVEPYREKILPGTGDVMVPPIRIEGPIPSQGAGATGTTNGNANTNSTKNGDDVPPTLDEKPNPPVDEKPKDDPGVIVIKRSSGGPPTVGGSQDVEKLTESQKLTRQAREQFQLGKFESAAKLYEQALRSGASTGLTNQRIGQCYDNLGRKAEAIAAYTRAANAYEVSMKSGEGGIGVQSALDACRQALRALQGG